MPVRKNSSMTARRLTPLLLLGAAALAACTNTDTLQSAKQENTGAPAVAAAAGSASPATPPGASSVAVKITALQLAPIVGISVEAADPLTQRLTQRAKDRAIPMATKQASPSHVLKGYFSALPEGKETTVVYVWDLLDNAGNRLHRIQGQEKVMGGGGWPSVPATTMQTIADKTMDDLGRWLAGASGSLATTQ